ncbi:hypothetical protein BKA67DRAFT_668109 [Truncatella angustata]|uniref:Uncharacterized protein n=1 Tax=Truncatella angustata TaxID=152316 RepID=A0A9P8UYZ7_9PEZI|nr:uncharacterized protein BKA67DRAFT_668109 [Truncatella angustata]KAH6661166.1 hypothetical protein BKA67DRAFT_668109 [Truncatella angustata]KAH8194235.1 hypothetical protein TruAng_011594 [Truncatella angustata]
MQYSQLFFTTFFAATVVVTGALSIQPRQSSVACNIARLQIVKAISDTKKAVADIQDPAVQDAATAGIQQAQSGVAQVAQSIFTGAATSAAGRDGVEAGLNATSTALAGGDTTDTAVANAQTSLEDAITAGQDVLANC